MAETRTGGGGAGESGDGEELNQSQVTRPPVSPEHEWRARAIAAEDGLKKAQEALAQLQSQFDEHKAQASASERRRQIGAAATQASALDVDLVVMLVEAQLAQTPDADVQRVVADLKRNKPFLFANDPGSRTTPTTPTAPTPTTAAGAAVSAAASASDALLRKADEARATGDRRALLGYLRARRGV